MDNHNTSRYAKCQTTLNIDANINVKQIEDHQQQQLHPNKNQHILLSKHVQNLSCYLNQNEAEPSLYNNSLCYDQGAVGGSFLDSGYTSCNVTHNLTRQSSFTLPRIDEDLEFDRQTENLNSSTTTTPVTRNIQKINALHLTTPNDKMSTYEACSTYPVIGVKVSPIKRTIAFANMEYTPKKTRTDLLQMTPPKSCSPRNHRRLINSSTKRRNPSFRDTLYTLTETENELNPDNIENESSENNISVMEFSPIPQLKLKTPNANNVLQEKRLPLEKTVENRLQSSTPFNSAYQPNFYIKNEETIPRNHLLPKSASPKRRQQIYLKKNPSVDLGQLSMKTKQNTQFNFNPAKKLLHFDMEKSSKKLLHEEEDTKKTEKIKLRTYDSCNNSLDEVFLPNKSDTAKVKTPVSRKLLVRQKAIESSTIPEVPELNLSNIDNINVESKVELSLTPEVCRRETNTVQRDNDLSIIINPVINEYSFKTPLASPSIINIDDSSIQDFSFALDNSSKTDDKSQSLCFNLDNLLTGEILTLEKEKNLILFNEGLLTTPKKIKRCKSLTQKQHNNKQEMLQAKQDGVTSIDGEKNIILHPYLPCTPPKKNKISKTFLKRLNSFRIKCNTMKKTKTKLFTIDKEFNYVGKRYVDILNSLKNTAPPLERIFFYLNGKDLANCSMVSRCWKSIIENSRKVNKKRLNYIKKICKIKENRCVIDKNSVSIGERRKLLRFPFNSTSINIEPENTTVCGGGGVIALNGRKRVATIERSPPVSPSKRKFHENQKIVRHLDKDVKLTKCPRCTMSSEIISLEKITKSNTANNLNDTIDVLDPNYRPNLLIRTPVKNNRKSQIVQRANTICASTVTSPSSINTFNNSDKMSATTIINFDDTPSLSSVTSPIKMMRKSNYICKLDFSSIDDGYCPRRPMTRSSINSLNDNHKKYQSLDNLDRLKCNNTMRKRNSLVSSDNSNNNGEKIVYAVCLGTTCGYKFCIKCFCEYHDDRQHKCMDCDYGQRSPNRDDDQMFVKTRASVGSRQSKRILRRL